MGIWLAYILLKLGNLVDDKPSESLETVVQELSSEVRSTRDHEMEGVNRLKHKSLDFSFPGSETFEML